MADLTPVRGILRRLAGAAPGVLPQSTLQAVLALRSRLSDALPTAGLPRFASVVVVAPHPDDETIVAGGTIALLSDRGATVTVIVVTDGEATLGGLSPQVLGTRRGDEVVAACRQLGVTDVRRLGLPDGNVASHIDDLVGYLRTTMAETTPQLVILPWFGDDHPDHRAVNVGLARALVGMATTPPTEIWGGEAHTPGPITRVVDITEVVDRKRAALAEHATAARAFDTEATLGLSRYRSLVAQRGRGHAEGFVAADTAAWLRWMDQAARGAP